MENSTQAVPYRPGRTWVVVATAAEASHLNIGDDLLISGIGKVPTAIELAIALGRERRPVINLGSAGALRSGVSGLFVPSEVTQHDVNAAALAALGYPVRNRHPLSGGDGSVLATGDQFISDARVRDDLVARLAVAPEVPALCDMEGFAVAATSARFEVPCTLVKVVTDEADAAALAWPELVDAAARTLADWLVAHTV